MHLCLTILKVSDSLTHSLPTKRISYRKVGGVVLPGFAPSLESVLGAGSFYQGNEEHRFAALATSGSRLVTAFVACWGSLRADAVTATLALERDLEGPLAADVEAAGTLDGEVIGKMQRAPTEQRESLRRDTFEQDARRLLALTDPRRVTWQCAERFSTQSISAAPLHGLTDPRRVTWECAERFSTKSISAAPLHGLYINNAECQEMLAAYYGLPSPVRVRQAWSGSLEPGP
jgi:hypothetical protein